MTASVTWDPGLGANPAWSITRAGYIICGAECKMKMSLLQKAGTIVKDTNEDILCPSSTSISLSRDLEQCFLMCSLMSQVREFKFLNY